jgi:DKNYY family
MVKILFILSIIFVVSFLLFFPFWHVGGHYYRGLLLIYDIRPASGGGFIPPLSFERDISLVKWADPTSFEYVHGGQYYSYAKDRFNVYCDKFRLDNYDPNTFRQVQAPITGEWFYVDKDNVRFYNALILKAVSGERMGDGRDIITDKFDVNSIQSIGANIIKDKNGIYTYFRSASFSEDMNQPYGWGDRTIELFKKHKELDAETFIVDFCDEKNCQASDKNGTYTLNRTDSSGFVNIKKIE